MIRVNEDFVIDVDERRYTPKEDLHKTSVDKDGKERNVYKIIGYYTSFQGAVNAICEYKFKTLCKNEEIQLAKCVELLAEIKDEIHKALNF